MPDLPISPETTKESITVLTDASVSKGIEFRLIPGRGVSVQIGPRFSRDIVTSRAQVLVVALLEASACCETLFQASSGEWRDCPFEGTKVIVVGARVPYVFKSSSCKNVVMLILEPRFVYETARSEVAGVTTGDIVALGRRDALLAQSIAAFRSLCCGEKQPTALYVECIGTVMATHVLHTLFDGEAPIDRRGGLPIEALRRVIAHIDAHYHEDYDLAKLARIAGFSRNHFCRLFEKSIGRAPRTYYRGCQVEHAIVLLQTTDLKVIDIAQQCGFCDQTQMARWFWDLRHINPSDVRDVARQ